MTLHVVLLLIEPTHVTLMRTHAPHKRNERKIPTRKRAWMHSIPIPSRQEAKLPHSQT